MALKKIICCILITLTIIVVEISFVLFHCSGLMFTFLGGIFVWPYRRTKVEQSFGKGGLLYYTKAKTNTKTKKNSSKIKHLKNIYTGI